MGSVDGCFIDVVVAQKQKRLDQIWKFVRKSMEINGNQWKSSMEIPGNRNSAQSFLHGFLSGRCPCSSKARPKARRGSPATQYRKNGRSLLESRPPNMHESMHSAAKAQSNLIP